MTKCKMCGTIGEHDCGLESMKNMVAGFAEMGIRLTVEPMTNPSGEFEKKLDKAFEAHWEYHDSCDKTCFKAGAHYGIGAVIEFLRSDTMNGRGPNNWWQENGHWGDDYAQAIAEHFNAGQASDGGKE